MTSYPSELKYLQIHGDTLHDPWFGEVPTPTTFADCYYHNNHYYVSLYAWGEAVTIKGTTIDLSAIPANTNPICVLAKLDNDFEVVWYLLGESRLNRVGMTVGAGDTLVIDKATNKLFWTSVAAKVRADEAAEPIMSVLKRVDLDGNIEATIEFSAWDLPISDNPGVDYPGIDVTPMFLKPYGTDSLLLGFTNQGFPDTEEDTIIVENYLTIPKNFTTDTGVSQFTKVAINLPGDAEANTVHGIVTEGTSVWIIGATNYPYGTDTVYIWSTNGQYREFENHRTTDTYGSCMALGSNTFTFQITYEEASTWFNAVYGTLKDDFSEIEELAATTPFPVFACEFIPEINKFELIYLTLTEEPGPTDPIVTDRFYVTDDGEFTREKVGEITFGPLNSMSPFYVACRNNSPYDRLYAGAYNGTIYGYTPTDASDGFLVHLPLEEDPPEPQAWSILPTSIDFGTIEEGPSAAEEVVITVDEGTVEDVTISLLIPSYELSEDGSTWVDNLLPGTLEEGTYSFYVRLKAGVDYGLYIGEIIVEGTDVTPLSVGLEASVIDEIEVDIIAEVGHALIVSDFQGSKGCIRLAPVDVATPHADKYNFTYFVDVASRAQTSYGAADGIAVLRYGPDAPGSVVGEYYYKGEVVRQYQPFEVEYDHSLQVQNIDGALNKPPSITYNQSGDRIPVNPEKVYLQNLLTCEWFPGDDVNVRAMWAENNTIRDTKTTTLVEPEIPEFKATFYVPSDDLTVILPLVNSGGGEYEFFGEIITFPEETYTYDFHIDGGDGSEIQHIDRYDHENRSHTYSTPGEYQITVTGTMQMWRYWDVASSTLNGTPQHLISVDQVGAGFCEGVKDFATMFVGCANLQSICELDTSLGIDFRGMFVVCANLESIPLLDTSSGVNFDGMFEGCSSLSNVPFLDTSSGVGFNFMFAGCSSLSNVHLSDTSSGVNFEAMFADCTSLETVSMPGINRNISFADCPLPTIAAREDIYENSLAGVGEPGSDTYTITMPWPDVGEDDRIAQDKGWLVQRIPPY